MPLFSESRAKQRRDLTLRAFQFLNVAHADGRIFSSSEIFEGIRDFERQTIDWIYGLFRRLKREGVVEMLGKFDPHYKALKTFEITEDLITDYANTTVKGIPPKNVSQPVPIMRFGQAQTGDTMANSYDGSAPDPSENQQEPDSKKLPSEVRPSVEEMLTAFLQLLPVLAPAIQRIEKRQVEIDKNLKQLERLVTESKDLLRNLYVELGGKSEGP